jgi:ABC-type polysaccharide/polyol phosphate transport system ATPase subunit/ABC-type polysaccharide/polyol phosphate export permease
MSGLPAVEPRIERRPRHRSQPTLTVRHLSKSFPTAGRAVPALKQLVRSPLGGIERRRVEVLRDVSFSVERGEFFAIVGSNGSGKSTLLRCIAGIYQPEQGELSVDGRIAPFIELGSAFHPDLDAVDNIALVGTLIGLESRVIRGRTPEILEFAELGEFTQMPVRNYSSGMEARLAFAISLAGDADVLLFDEVLAVGDVAFREKCFGAFERLRREGRTVVYVSHQLETVSRFADRAMLLERGRAPRTGAPEEILHEYRQRSSAGMGGPGTPLHVAAPAPAAPRAGAGGAKRARRRRFAEVTRALSAAEYKIRYLDSFLGYLWALVQPLLMFAVLYFVLSKIVRYEDVSDYAIQLLLGVVLFNYFTEATGLALPSLVVRANLLRRIAFPPAAVPTASALTSAITFAVGLVLALCFAVLSGIAPSPRWLELIPLAGALLAFTVGVSLVLAALFVNVRDARPIWAVVSRVLFFATPVFYPIAAVPDGLRHVMMANPIAAAIVGARSALGIGGPDAAAAIGGAVWLLVPALIALAAPCLAYWLFRRQTNLAERL